MLDKVIEQLGQATQQKIADAVATIQDKSEAERVYLVDLIADTHSNFSTQLEEKERQLTDDINDVDTRNQARYVEETQQIVTKLQELEVYAAQLATIKDGKQGEQGLQGEPGLDKPLLEPVQLVDKDYPKSTLGLHNGGLWISTKDSVGCPESDPHAWSCILDSMTTMSIDLQEDHTFKLQVRMATGKLIEDSFQIPYPEHKGIWEEGEYKQGQIVTKGSSFWQAMENTAGEPPGNGWKQILTAPRGKVGPAGKSIEGPQGKPGRNGMDAKLPPNFVDDLIAIASERKAFEDGREAAYAITSFRGYFQRGESYSSGDVVNFDGGIYLCTTSGTFESIASSAGSFELILGVPSSGPSAAYMFWQGRYVAKSYNTGMVVADGPWTMVANKQTNDSAGPYPIGDESYLAAGATYAPLADTVKNVIFGTRVKLVQAPIFVRGYKIDVIDTFSYRVFFVQDPLNSPILVELASFTATATETLEVTLGRIPVGAGDSFDIVAVVNEPDPTPTEWTGNWDYDTPNNVAIPPAGVVLHANQNPASLRVSTLDDVAGDRTAELAALSPGDTIGDGSSLWTISQSVDNGTWFDFTVSPAQQSPSDGVRTFTFSTTTPTPITIGSDADYWLGNENFRGIHGVDGGYSDAVEDDNAYSIDLEIQDAYVSPDWDVVAYSSEMGAQPEAMPVFTQEETAWVQASSSPLNTATALTTGAAWTEIGRIPVADIDAFKAALSIDAKRIDQIEYHVSEWTALVYHDGTEIVDYLQKEIELGADLSVRTKAVGGDVIMEVKGKPNQEWAWTMTLFHRSLV